MLKKSFAIVVVLFLAACSSKMSGATTTTCTDASFSSSYLTEVPFGTIIIEGYDEEINVWTERIEQSRSEYIDLYWGGVDPGDEELEEWFATVGEAAIETGFSWTLFSLDEDAVIHGIVYDYSLIPTSELSEIWGVDDFEKEVTLTAAIAGLEDHTATTCTTD
jgi:hypothetical protein